ncbi:MAG: TraR/DksA C4-type zinc finger protein [Candidatus Omnitrophica bacterium]|nr:TraR/DksA C4-type zinc finger protein [Candidatus Omnitrophota bacterium]
MKKTMIKKTSQDKTNKKNKSNNIKKRFSKKELEFYKEKLLNLKDDIMNQISDMAKETFMKTQKEMSGDMSGYGLHIADAASDNYERDFSLDLVSSERKIVLEIDAALKRVEDGTYGVCLKSGKPISKARLNAIPYAKYSRKCQEEIEKEKKT